MLLFCELFKSRSVVFSQPPTICNIGNYFHNDHYGKSFNMWAEKIIAIVESVQLLCWLHQYFSRIFVKDSLSVFISNCSCSTETQKNANEFNESKLSLPAYCYLCHTPGKLRCWQCLMNRVKSLPFQETRLTAGNGLNATAFFAKGRE